MSRTHWTFGALVALALMALAAPQPAVACSCFCDSICSSLGDCCPWCPGGIEIQFGASVKATGPSTADLTVGSALTTSMVTSATCLTSIANLDGVARVDSVDLVNVANGVPILTFTPNPRTGVSLEQAIAEASVDFEGTWQGLSVQIPRDIEDGIATAFQVHLTLEPGVNFAQLVQTLRDKGAFAGGAGHPDGTFDFSHSFLRPLGDALVVAGPNERNKKPAPMDRLQ